MIDNNGRETETSYAVQHIQTSVLLNHVEHDVADNTVYSYDNNYEDGDDDTDDEDHDRGEHVVDDDYGNGHGHEDDGDGNNHKDSNDHVEGDINDHGDEDSDDIWSVRERPSMRHILLRETQRNCKLRGRAEDKTNKTQIYIQGLSLPAKCCHEYFPK